MESRYATEETPPKISGEQLYKAIIEGNVDEVRYQISLGADTTGLYPLPEYVGSEFSLFQVALEGIETHAEILSLLLDTPAVIHIDRLDRSKLSILTRVIYNVNYDSSGRWTALLKKLLSKNPTITSKDFSNANYETMKLLLEHIDKVSVIDRVKYANREALLRGVLRIKVNSILSVKESKRNKVMEEINLILKHGAKPDKYYSGMLWSIIQSRRDDEFVLESVELCFKYGSDSFVTPFRRDQKHEDYLQTHHFFDIVWRIENYYQLQTETKTIDNFVTIVQWGYTKLAREYLQELGVEILKHQGILKMTPLHLAITSKPFVPMIRLLIESGADLNVEDSQGNSPLRLLFELREADFAFYEDYEDLVRYRNELLLRILSRNPQSYFSYLPQDVSTLMIPYIESETPPVMAPLPMTVLPSGSLAARPSLSTLPRI